MNKFVIYNEEGKIVFSKLGYEEGIFKNLNIEEPPGKELVSIDPETDEPIFQDKPKDVATLINEIKEKLDANEEMTSEIEAGLYDIAEMVSNLLEGGN